MACFYRWDKVYAAFEKYIAGSIIINTNELPPQTYIELRNIKHMTLLYSWKIHVMYLITEKLNNILPYFISKFRSLALI